MFNQLITNALFILLFLHSVGFLAVIGQENHKKLSIHHLYKIMSIMNRHFLLPLLRILNILLPIHLFLLILHHTHLLHCFLHHFFLHLTVPTQAVTHPTVATATPLILLTHHITVVLVLANKNDKIECKHLASLLV